MEDGEGGLETGSASMVPTLPLEGSPHLVVADPDLNDATTERLVFLSEALTGRAVEGGQVLAVELERHFRVVHGASAIGPADCELPHVVPLLDQKAVGSAAIGQLRRERPTKVVYLPAHGLTPATLARCLVIWLAAHRPRLEIV